MKIHAQQLNKYKILGVLLFVALVLLTFLGSTKVLALGGKYFDDVPGSGGCDLGVSGYNGGNYSAQNCVSPVGVRLTVGQDRYVPISVEVLQASIASGATPPASTSITIHGLDLCAGVGGSNVLDRKYGGYFQSNALAAAAPVTHFQVGGQSKNGVNRNDPTKCHQPTATSTGPDDWTFNLVASDFTQLPGVPGVWVVAITVTHIDNHAGTCDNTTTSGCDGIRNGFSITAGGGLIIATKAGNGANCGPIDGKCTTVHGETDSSSDKETFMFRFGSDCTVPAGGIQAEASFYDLDWNTSFPDRTIKETIQDIAPNGTVRWLWDNNGSPGAPSWQATRPSFAQSVQRGPFNGGTSKLKFWADPYHKYILYVENVSADLEMQVGTPYDGAYYTASCPAPPSISPSTSITPGVVGVGQNFTAQAGLTSGSTTPATVTTGWHTWLDNGDKTYGAGDTLVGADSFPASYSVSSTTPKTFGPTGGTADSSHQYVCTELYSTSVVAPATLSPPPSTPSVAPYITCVPIVLRPYYSVLGGDVAAGAGFGVPGVAGASVIGSNNDGSPNYNGASAQLATLALANIQSFVTGKSQNGGVGPTWKDWINGSSSPSGLAFTNTSPTPPIYGGGFNQPGWAVQDYYGTPTGQSLGAGPVDVGALNGTYVYNGPLTLTSTTPIAPGKKIKLYVKGDVFITGSNITYAASGLTNIPQFQLIVKGNINVDPNISRLDGFYAAQDDGTNTKGKFSTCATSTGPITDATTTAASAISTCGVKQLIVNGAIAAQKIVPNRTYGDIGGGGGNQLPGEMILFSPAFWLPNASGGPSLGRWDSVTSLPPIL